MKQDYMNMLKVTTLDSTMMFLKWLVLYLKASNDQL